LRVFNATGEKLEGLVLFRDAENQEQKIMAVLTAMKELEEQGRKLEALQLGELMFGSKFVDNIRLGKTSVDSIMQSMEAAAEAGEVVFSQAMIERAKEVDDQLRLAHQRLDKEMKPSWQSLASIMLDIKEAWTWVVDKAAAFVQWINRADLSILKAELAEINKALEEGPNRGGLYSLWSDRMLQERRDALQGMIDDRSGPSTRPMITVNRPSRGEGAAPTKKDDETESRDRFESSAEAIEKRTAARNAETAAIDLGTAARERAKVVAELETVAMQTYGEITDETRERINAIADAWGNAAAAAEKARGPMASYIRDANDLGKAMENATVSGARQLENGLMDVISGTKSVGAAMKNMADAILEEVQRILIRKLIIAPIMMMLNSIIGGTGGGGMGGTLAPDQFAAAFPTPFASGGYTGPGGKYEPAGVVHRGEYVFDAESTARIGVANLEALRGYAAGGYVAAPGAEGGPEMYLPVKL
jgi:lambda family phage tail tape measure protein